jgi:heat-inducible transcriptional repressor
LKFSAKIADMRPIPGGGREHSLDCRWQYIVGMSEPLSQGLGDASVQLSERQKAVLSSIVHRYVGNAEPVGSRQVSKDIVDSLSPATIRNVMSDMEEMGLIDQPHTSAGRQPTERGFRVWVDQIMPTAPLSEQERQVVDTTLSMARTEEQLLASAALALAEVTRLLGLAITPILDSTRLERLELVRVGDTTLLVVASFGSGLIRSIAVETGLAIPTETLSDLVRRLHLTALGRTPTQLERHLKDMENTEVRPEDPYADVFQLILRSLLEASHPVRSSDAFLQGTSHVLAQPEMGERRSMTNLMQLLEDRSLLVQLLQERVGHDGVYITIGSENRVEHLRPLSLVTRNYRIGDALGAVGVLGPTRMPYAKLASAVDYIALRLTQG